MVRSLPLLAALAAAALAVAAAPARAAAPCWKELINDWYDGRIDKVYPVKCYREALRHLPPDVDTYSSARDDINRALANRIAGKNQSPPGSGATGRDSSRGSGKTTPGSGAAGKDGGGSAGSGAPGRDRNGGGPLGGAIKDIGPDSADAVPIPLLVLGSLAVFLLLLGSAGFLARRLQARRAAVRPATDSRAQKP